MADWQQELAAQRAQIREAGERNARGLQRRQALHNARAAHMGEATGIVFPHPGDLGGHPGDAGAWAAYDHFLCGRVPEAAAALDRQAAGETSKARAARNRTLAARLRAAEVKPTLPALARIRGTAAGMTAIDHDGIEYAVTLQGSELTLTRGDATVRGPAGDDPTRAARELAGQLNTQAEEAAARAFAELEEHGRNAERDRQEHADMRERQAQWRATEGNRDAPPNDGSLLLTEGYRTLGRLSKARAAERAAPATAGRQTAFPDIEPEA